MNQDSLRHPRRSKNADIVDRLTQMDIEPVTLSDGSEASLIAERMGVDGWELTVDGFPQSFVVPQDPTTLQYAYVRRIGDVIDNLPGCAPRAAITAVHLGAGACTLPLYVSATRPRSRQQVLEREPAIIELVRHIVSFPKGIRFRYGDAAASLSKLPHGLHHAADIVVHDLYAGETAPAAMRTPAAIATIRELLRPGGTFVMNLATVDDRQYVKRVIASVMTAFAHVVVISEHAVFTGKHDGNFVVIGRPEAFPPRWVEHVLAVGPKPSEALTSERLHQWLGGAAAL